MKALTFSYTEKAMQ